MPRERASYSDNSLRVPVLLVSGGGGGEAHAADTAAAKEQIKLSLIFILTPIYQHCR